MNDDASPNDGIHLPLMLAADLQDHLLTASNDLDRLQTLLSDACDDLMRSFSGVSDQLRALMTSDGDPLSSASGTSASGTSASATSAANIPAETIQALLQQLGAAVTALQFQDMASQLIAHTHTRLRNCSDKLARETFEPDDDEPDGADDAPMRSNPVTQAEMDAGSVELF